MSIRFAAVAGLLLLLPVQGPAAEPVSGGFWPALQSWVAEHGAPDSVRMTTWDADGLRTEAVSWAAAENFVQLVEARLAYLQREVEPLVEGAPGLPWEVLDAVGHAEPGAPRAIGGGKNLDSAGGDGCGAVMVRMAWMGYTNHPVLLSAVPVLAGPVPGARFCTPPNGGSLDAAWAEIVLDGHRGGDGYWYNTAAAQVRLFPRPDGGPLWDDDVLYAVVRGAARAFLFDACDFFCFSYMAVEGDGATVELYDGMPPRLGDLVGG